MEVTIMSHDDETRERRRGPFEFGGILKAVREELEGAGIEVDLGTDSFSCCGPRRGGRVKVVCVAPGLKDSVEEMGKTPRDQVVMVRVDAETSAALDAWVETGAVKSRSEAAALFIREGLKVRSDELEHLREALGEVESARERLRRRAREVLGDEPEPEGGSED
jgi:hypothetical protein